MSRMKQTCHGIHQYRVDYQVLYIPTVEIDVDAGDARHKPLMFFVWETARINLHDWSVTRGKRARANNGGALHVSAVSKHFQPPP